MELAHREHGVRAEPTADAATVRTESNLRAIRASIREIATTLESVLSRRLTAYVVNVCDGKTVSRWANGEILQIRDRDTEQKLRTAFEISDLLLRSGTTPNQVRAWFISLSPSLQDEIPADVIRAGRLPEARNAAQTFVANL